MSAVRHVMSGVGPLLDSDGKPARWSRERCQRYADKRAAGMHPPGFWRGVVFESPDYFRINYAGQPDGRHGSKPARRAHAP